MLWVGFWSNRLPAGAENVGSIFASTLSTAEAFVPVDNGGRGETEGIGEDHRRCLHL